MTVMGVDIGGTGSRVTLDGRGLSGPGAGVGGGGSSVPRLVDELTGAAWREWPDAVARVSAVGIGATGVASLVDDPAGLADGLSRRLGVPVALASDAVTAHLGALDGRGGSVVVLGTGAVAVGHPGPDADGVYLPQWRRVDGWGHLLGDRGSGAWVGRKALETAARAVDGVIAPDGADGADAADGAALLRAAVRRFGEPSTWPAQFYTRDDRAGLMAGFARDVADLADGGDAASVSLLSRAGREAARSALAALDGGGLHSPDCLHCPRRVVLSGGFARAGGALTEGFRAEVADQVTGEVTVEEPAGSPLDGARVLARLAAAGLLRSQAGLVWNARHTEDSQAYRARPATL